MKDVLGKNLPTVIEVTLLSSEELEACADTIETIENCDHGYYYLRTAYEDNTIGVACGYMEEEEPSPVRYEDYPYKGPYGTMLRPILRLASANLKDGTLLEAGDNVVIGKNTFTAISDTILFSDKAAWYDADRDSYGYFDDETNVYENSLAKKRVDAWFEEKIKPNL